MHIQTLQMDGEVIHFLHDVKKVENITKITGIMASLQTLLPCSARCPHFGLCKIHAIQNGGTQISQYLGAAILDCLKFHAIQDGGTWDSHLEGPPVYTTVNL